MEDIADLGLSAAEYGIDRYHDKVYDTATRLPDKVKVVKRRFSKPNAAGEVVEEKETIETDPRNNCTSRRTTTTTTNARPNRDYSPLQDYDPQSRRRRSSRQMSTRDDVYSDAGYSRGGPRSSRGVDRDTYEPEQQSMRSYAGRDGYAPSSYAYDAAERGEDPRYLEYERGGGDYGRRSEYDERSRRGYDDEEEEEGNRELQRRSRSRGGSRSRADSRPGSSRGFGGEHHKGQNDDMKKWGATIAGAAIGAYGGRVATSKHGQHKDNWVPTAIGAVVGGLIAREAEKEYFKRKEHKNEQREMEDEEWSNANRRYQ